MEDSTQAPEAVRRAIRAFVDTIALAEPLVFELWRSHELTLVQVQCLHMLRSGRELAGELARRLNLSSASVTRILERLESRDLITRAMDLHDRRRIWVQLTETGRNMLGGLQWWFTSPIFKAIKSMDADELERLTLALTAFVERVHETSPSTYAAGTSFSNS